MFIYSYLTLVGELQYAFVIIVEDIDFYIFRILYVILAANSKYNTNACAHIKTNILVG